MKKSEKGRPGSEADVVEMFRTLFEPDIHPSDLLVGIGDDAAVIEPGVDPESKLVLTADMLMEDIHFRQDIHSLYDIGYRTAVSNLSDIAAMGAVPRWALCTLATPKETTIEQLREIGLGLRDALGKHETYLIGGDLTSSPGPISISMTIIGESTGRLLTRTGAELGDVIAVTGFPGDRSAGLEILLSELKPELDISEYLVQKHLRPEARVREGQFLAGVSGIKAMMDISDGLGLDLTRLADASGVGYRIFEEMFPVTTEMKKAAEAMGKDPLDFINGGEEYELLIAGDRDAVEYAGRMLAEDSSSPRLTIIGDILDRPLGMHLLRIDGTVVNPSKMGWDHFRR